MRRHATALTLLLLFAASAQAQAKKVVDPGPSISLPAEVKVQPGRLASVQVTADAKAVTYEVLGDDLDVFREYDPGPTVIRLRIIGYKLGTYYVVVAAATGDRVALAKCKVTVEGAVPKPPDPGPTPGPGPPPSPVVGGLRVLIVYDASQAAALPASQQTVLYGKEFRDFLNAKTAAGPGGKWKEWRIYDKGVDASAEAKVWRDWLARPRAKTPWVVIGGDSGVAYEGPLPTNLTDALALVQKYAPPAARKYRKAG